MVRDQNAQRPTRSQPPAGGTALLRAPAAAAARPPTWPGSSFSGARRPPAKARAPGLPGPGPDWSPVAFGGPDHGRRRGPSWTWRPF